MKTKIFKSVVSIVLVLTMLFGMGVTAYAASNVTIIDGIHYQYIGKDGWAAVTAADTTITEAKILPAVLINGEFENVIDFNREGFSLLDRDGFENCTELKSVVIPSTMKEIYNDNFKNCPKLESITIPKSITRISYSSFDTVLNENLKIYYGGTAEEYAVIENAPTGKMEYCNNVHDFSTEYYSFAPTCQEYGRTFYICKCGEVKTVEGTQLGECADNDKDGFCDFCGKEVGSYENYSSSELDFVLNLNTMTASVLRFKDTVKDVQIPSELEVDGEKYVVNEILKEAFKESKLLETVIIPMSVETIGEHAFVSCKNLKSLVIPSTVNRIDYSIVFDCDSLETISLPKDYYYHDDGGTNVFYFADAKTVYYYGTEEGYAEKYDVRSTDFNLVCCNNKHDFSTVHYTTKEATCLEYGETVNVCKCGQCKVVAGTEYADCVDSDKDNICDVCGKEMPTIATAIKNFGKFIEFFTSFFDKVIEFFRGIGDIF